MFWLWPLSVALPLYAAVSAVSLLVYAYAWKVWRMPRLNGLEAMLGVQGKVVAVGSHDVTVLLKGELWSAQVAGDALAVGDVVVVDGAEGLSLRVRGGKANAGAVGTALHGHHWFHQRRQRTQS